MLHVANYTGRPSAVSAAFVLDILDNNVLLVNADKVNSRYSLEENVHGQMPNSK